MFTGTLDLLAKDSGEKSKVLLPSFNNGYFKWIFTDLVILLYDRAQKSEQFWHSDFKYSESMVFLSFIFPEKGH